MAGHAGLIGGSSPIALPDRGEGRVRLIIFSILVLVALFVGSAVLPVNLGLLALAGTFIVGVAGAGLPTRDVMAGFPVELLVTLVGVTYLFALARENGTIALIVRGASRALGGRAAALPPLVFALACLMSALGAPGPAAVAMIAPIALNFARQYGLSPLLMGLMTIHGTQAGAFSPASIYGGITNQLLGRAGLASEPILLFLASLGFNAAIGMAAYAILRPRPGTQGGGPTEIVAPAPADAPERPVSFDQLCTMAGLLAMAVGALVFRLDIGLLAVSVIVLLAILAPRSHKGGFEGIDWSTVLLITGVVTYVDLMERLGAIDTFGTLVGAIGMPLLAALLICSMSGLLSAFASSTAMLGVMVPLAQPLLGPSGAGLMPLICAIAVSLTIVDTSPFSTNGALVVSSAAIEERNGLYRRLLAYTAGMVAAGPILAWAVFIAVPTLLRG
jgi:di/tricarboxylate transporter